MNILDLINSDEFDGVIRHIMTWFGGLTMITGHFDPTQWQTLAGGVVSVLGVLWSVANKRWMRGEVKSA